MLKELADPAYFSTSYQKTNPTYPRKCANPKCKHIFTGKAKKDLEEGVDYKVTQHSKVYLCESADGHTDCSHALCGPCFLLHNKQSNSVRKRAKRPSAICRENAAIPRELFGT